MPKRNILPVLFDVRPKGKPVAVLSRQINLRKKNEPKAVVQILPSPPVSVTEQLIGNQQIANEKDIIANEVETALDHHETLVADLIRAGAILHSPSRQEKVARPRIVEQPRSYKQEIIEPNVVQEVTPEVIFEPEISIENDNKDLEAFWSQSPTTTVARASFEPSQTNQHRPTVQFYGQASPAARDVEVWVQRLKKEPAFHKKNTHQGWFSRIFRRRAAISAFVVLFAIAGISAAVFRSNAFVAKQNVLQNGASALVNLENAKKSLEEFNFAEAADRFSLASDDFDKASGTLNHFGASFISIFGNIPGFSKVRSANNLVEAGQNISKAGQGLALAFSSLYKTNFFASINLSGSSGNPSFSEPLDQFEKTLVYAQKNIKKAKSLLDGVDIDAIPEDKRIVFEDFKKKIPDFQWYIAKTIEYSDFVREIIGDQGIKTYLVLLQNTSERRATGGFPGTYAIVSFDHGVLKKVFVDDIYNTDGQIKENRIPPIPLQHITPSLGMRDVAWFADFPMSAKKIEEYYKLNGGAQLDGVLAIDPTLIERILGLVGPIEMQGYNVTLDEHNFLAQIQDEVEYGDNRAQPKKILVDFQPKFFEKLAAQDKNKWLDIMKILVQALEEKHILAYFNNHNLEKEVVRNGFGGQVKETESDYIQVVFNNIKGSKSDAVTANAMKLDVVLREGTIPHTLDIIRAHNGGQSQYQFYNKENPAYVKVYLPEEAIFDSIDGISHPDYKPLLVYSDFGFKPDPDIIALEQQVSHPMDGVDLFKESGKTVVGFWMITKPKKTNMVKLQYHMPETANKKYALLWQKQSGGDGDQIHVNVKLPDDIYVTNHSPETQILDNAILLDTDLAIDREVQVVYH